MLWMRRESCIYPINREVKQSPCSLDPNPLTIESAVDIITVCFVNEKLIFKDLVAVLKLSKLFAEDERVWNTRSHFFKTFCPKISSSLSPSYLYEIKICKFYRLFFI
jgi:hypothetical protein